MPITRTKQCIFCGGAPTVVEAVFSTWLGNRLPKGKAVTQLAVNPMAPSARTYPGTAFRGRAKVVCKKCNNEWMSQIEEKASRLLKPMLFGSLPIGLDSGAQVMSERLGHSSITVTLDLYSHAIPALGADAADKIAAVVNGF